MRVSVIIPTLNEESNISRAVRSAWEAGADEVIVADAESRDATRHLAKQAGALVIETPPGRGPQQNGGFQQASGDTLLFLHGDNWLGPECLVQLRTALDDPSLAYGGFRQRIDAPGLAYRALESGNAWRARTTGLIYGDQAIFVRREAFLAAGQFPSTRLMEDVELMHRLRRRRNVRTILPGPVHVSARRWRQQGVARQTIRNWSFLLAYQLGVAPDKLAQYYAR